MAIFGKQLAPNTVTSDKCDVTNGGISTVQGGDAASEGSGTGVSKRDHQHAVATGGTTAQVDIGDAAAEGASANLAREDHQHALPTPAAPVNVTKAAASAGASTTVARADHKHDADTAAAVELTDSTNAEGAATSLARSNHTHAHGARSGGTLHSTATTGTAGFMSSSDKSKLDTLVDPLILAPKDALRLLATADLVTLSGNQTVDGVLTAPGERVGLFSQSTSTEDGIYVTNAGAWTRAADFALASSQAGAVFPVEEGTANADTFWQLTNDAPNDVVGTDDLVLLLISAGAPRGAGAGLVLNSNDLDIVATDGSITVVADSIGVGVLQSDAQHGARGGGSQHADVVAAGASGFMTGADKTKLNGITAGAQPNTTYRQERVTTESIVNSDTVLTDVLNFTPTSDASLLLLFNGVAAIQGAGEDYTVSGTAITWLASSGTAPNMNTNDDLIAYYES